MTDDLGRTSRRHSWSRRGRRRLASERSARLSARTSSRAADLRDLLARIDASLCASLVSHARIRIRPDPSRPWCRPPHGARGTSPPRRLDRRRRARRHHAARPLRRRRRVRGRRSNHARRPRRRPAAPPPSPPPRAAARPRDQHAQAFRGRAPLRRERRRQQGRSRALRAAAADTARSGGGLGADLRRRPPRGGSTATSTCILAGARANPSWRSSSPSSGNSGSRPSSPSRETHCDRTATRSSSTSTRTARCLRRLSTRSGRPLLSEIKAVRRRPRERVEVRARERVPPRRASRVGGRRVAEGARRPTRRPRQTSAGTTRSARPRRRRGRRRGDGGAEARRARRRRRRARWRPRRGWRRWRRARGDAAPRAEASCGEGGVEGRSWNPGRCRSIFRGRTRRSRGEGGRARAEGRRGGGEHEGDGAVGEAEGAEEGEKVGGRGARRAATREKEAPERRTHTWSSVPRHRKSCAFRVVTRKIQAKIFFGKRASVPARHTHTSPAHALDTVTRYTCPPSPFPPPPFVRSAPPSGTSATVFGRSIIHPSCRTRSASHDRNIRSGPMRMVACLLSRSLGSPPSSPPLTLDYLPLSSAQPLLAHPRPHQARRARR